MIYYQEKGGYMKELCKHCRSDKRVKNGYVHGKQRWKCKECCKTYREGDLRENIQMNSVCG